MTATFARRPRSALVTGRADDPPPGTDAAVIASSLTRPEAFEGLFDRHASALHRYAARRVGPVAGDDIVSGTFLLAFERRVRYDLARPHALPWLYGIATNLLREHRRDEVRMYRALARTGLDPVEGGHEDRVAAAVDASGLTRQLGAALAELSTRDRDVLLLFAWAQLGYDDIARALDVPVGTVRSRLHRARRLLRAALHDAAIDAGHDTKGL